MHSNPVGRRRFPAAQDVAGLSPSRPDIARSGSRALCRGGRRPASSSLAGSSCSWPGWPARNLSLPHPSFPSPCSPSPSHLSLLSLSLLSPPILLALSLLSLSLPSILFLLSGRKREGRLGYEAGVGELQAFRRTLSFHQLFGCTPATPLAGGRAVCCRSAGGCLAPSPPR